MRFSCVTSRSEGFEGRNIFWATETDTFRNIARLELIVSCLNYSLLMLEYKFTSLNIQKKAAI